MLTLIPGTIALPLNQTHMLIPRAVSRFVAQLMLGVLVFAQMAVAAHACPVMSGQTGDASGRLIAMGANPAPDVTGNDGAAKSAPQSLCTAHCQAGQQSADSKPAPSPPLALLTIRYALPMLEHGGEDARQLAATNDPSLAADPPHAVLHCCLRI